MALTKEQLIQQSKDLVAQSGQMLAQTKAEGSKPFTGSAFDIQTSQPLKTLGTTAPLNAPLTMPASNTINVDTLGQGTKPVIPPQAPTTPVDYGAITGSLGVQTPPTDAQGGIKEAPKAPTTPLETAQGQTKTFMERIDELFKKQTGKSAFETEQMQAKGIEQQEKDVQELTNQLNQIQTEAKQIQVGAPGEFAKQGISAGAIAGLTNEQLKENALKALTVSAQLEAKRGNLNLAYSQVDRAVKLKYEPLEKELEAKEKQLALLDKYVLSPLETQRKEELAAKLAAEKEKLQAEREKEQDFNKLFVSASANKIPNNLSTKARELFAKGDVYGAEQILAQYQENPLDIAYKNAQIANIYSTINDRVSSRTGVGDGGESAAALAAEYASTGKLPSASDMKAAGTNAGEVMRISKSLPKNKGAVIDMNTGAKPDISDAKIDGFAAMYDIANKIKIAKEQFNTIAAKGLVSGIISKVAPTADQQNYLNTRKEIVDLIARARTGAALTASEEAFYTGMLPSVFNKTLFLGGSGARQLDNFEKNITGTLKTKLQANGADIIGRQEIIDGKTVTRAYQDGQWGWETE